MSVQYITCPECGWTSYNRNDIAHGYCGNCHDWTNGVVTVEDDTLRRELAGKVQAKALRNLLRDSKREWRVNWLLAGTTMLAVIVLLLLVGCSAIASGTIVKKEVEKAYTYVTYQCSMYNPKTGACQVQIPVWHNVPEQYRFDIEEGDEEGYVYVDSITYQEYEVGDYWREPVQQ